MVKTEKTEKNQEKAVDFVFLLLTNDVLHYIMFGA